MKAWRLAGPGGALTFETRPSPALRPGAVRLRMKAVPLLSYLGDYVAGSPPYWYPPSPFTPGTNGVGVVEAVGEDVFHLAPGQRVLTSPHLLANERVEEPAQMLIGLTGISAESGRMLAAWPDGTLAEEVLMPAAALMPLVGLDDVPAERAAAMGKFLVPMGGLLRGRLAAGETLIVNGATGYFGSAAVLLGLAMAAGRVVLAGLDTAALAQLAELCGGRAATVALSGDVAADCAALREASGGGAHLALDLVGRASDTGATLATLRALRRGGRLVLMGSAQAPLALEFREMLANDWEVIGNFMYRAEAMHRLAALVRAGLLDLGAVRIATFPLAALPEAIEAASRMRGLDCTVVMAEGEPA